ncbi:MAG: hypothetical protein D6675_10365 [Gemmatimonadetes bacterium]|nr:MAG: hypothetical protein D6675_10365 [Gemmatimonadota bacterium]
MLPTRFSNASQKGWIADVIVIILIIAVAVALVYIIEYPYRIEKEIEYNQKEMEARENLTRIAKALEQYKRDFGEYTDRKLLLRRYDKDVDQLRDPMTFEGYTIELVRTPQDTTYTIRSPYEPFGSIINGVRTWIGRPVSLPPDSTATKEGEPADANP